jgi:hypothetical protein
MLNPLKISVLTIGLCILSVALAPTVLQGSEENIQLAFKISGQTDRIQIISKEKVCTTPQKGERFSSEIMSKKLVMRKSFKTGDNEITTKLKISKIKMTVNGKDAPPIDELQETSIITDTLGKKLVNKTDGNNTFIPDMSLILPDKAVKPGDTWSHTVKATKAYPAELKLVFKLDKIEEIDGAECAVIQAKCISNEVFNDRYARSHLSIRNRIYFNIAEGKVVKNTSQTEFILTWLKTFKGLPLQRATFSTTSMTLLNKTEN